MKLIDKSVKSQLPSIVVLGLGVNGLGIVRNLGRRGIKCYGLYSSDREVGRKSRYCVAKRVPSLKVDEAGFHHSLKEILEEIGGRPVIYPSDDLAVAYLVKFREELEGLARYSFGCNSSVELLLDKFAFSEILEKVGITAPLTILMPNDLSAVSSDMFPCVCKPRKTFLAEDVNIDKVQLFKTRAEFGDYFKEASTGSDFSGEKLVLQKLVKGPDTNVVYCALYMVGGDASTIMTVRKIHQYPSGFGIASVCATESIPEITEETIRLLRHIGYSGLAEAEFKWDEEENRYHMIEINPRAWASNSIVDASACNIIAESYLSNTDDYVKIERRNYFSSKVIWIDEITYIGTLFRIIKSGRIYDLRIGKKAFYKKKYAYFSILDIMPLISSLKIFFNNLLKKK